MKELASSAPYITTKATEEFPNYLQSQKKESYDKTKSRKTAGHPRISI